jgi:hypothetical protein
VLAEIHYDFAVGKGHGYYRHQDPWGFWISIAFQFLLVIIVIAGGLKEYFKLAKDPDTQESDSDDRAT